jgi:hypothetical protein
MTGRSAREETEVTLSRFARAALGLALVLPLATCQQGSGGSIGGISHGGGPPITPIVELLGVAAVSNNDVWAVGRFEDKGPDQPLVEHWDGRDWRAISAPAAGTTSNILNGVAAAAPNDVWAVGFYQNYGGGRTLIEHWDGTAFSVVPSPNPAGEDNELHAVAAISASDAWAVGFSHEPQGPLAPLVLHWDGAAWHPVLVPSPGTQANRLYGIAAAASDDVWAVGYQQAVGAEPQALIEHWDGKTWSVVPSQSPGSVADLNAVTAVSRTEAWTVGTYRKGDGYPSLVERWDGTMWRVVASQDVGKNGNTLSAVSGLPNGQIWAAGSFTNGNGTLPLTERWDGRAWQVVRGPDTPADQTLNGVAVTLALEVWAVGSYRQTDRGPIWALVERWDGSQWRVVSSPRDGTTQ